MAAGWEHPVGARQAHPPAWPAPAIARLRPAHPGHKDPRGNSVVFEGLQRRQVKVQIRIAATSSTPYIADCVYKGLSCIIYLPPVLLYRADFLVLQ